MKLWSPFFVEQTNLVHSAAAAYLKDGQSPLQLTCVDYQVLEDAYNHDLQKMNPPFGTPSLPTRRIKEENWRQVDDMSIHNRPPCDCLAIPDRNDLLMKDVPDLHPAIKAWMEKPYVQG